MTDRGRFTAISLMGLLAAAVCSARTITVALDGSGEYTTIQAGIDAAVDGDEVVVTPGIYREGISFGGKNVTVRSIDPGDRDIVSDTVIDAGGTVGAVTFAGNENETCSLEGFTVKGGNGAPNGGGVRGRGTHARITRCVIKENVANDHGGGLYQCDGEISNCLITNNRAGSAGGGMSDCSGVVRNCVLSYNAAPDGYALYKCNGAIVNCTVAKNPPGTNLLRFNGPVTSCNGSISNTIVLQEYTPMAAVHVLVDSAVPTYSNICEMDSRGAVRRGSNPHLAVESDGDCRLRSEHGRWSPSTRRWVYDNVTSPCVDGGSPSSDFSKELWPHGNRINMGAYGGTSEASLSPSDKGLVANINNDDCVNFYDFSVIAQTWRLNAPLSRADLDHRGVVTMGDMVLFAEQWLLGSPIFEPLCHLWLNDAAGDLTEDISGFGRDGTLVNVGEGAWVAGRVGGGLELDGVDDFVRILGWKGVGEGRSRTCCAWVKTTDTAGQIVSWGAIGVPGGRWVFGTEGGGRLLLQAGGGAITGSAAICDGQWHHVAAVLDNDGSPNVNEIKLYVDGVEDTPSAAGNVGINTETDPASGGPDVRIGVWMAAPQYFGGTVDEVRIYERALDAAEVMLLATEAGRAAI